MHKLSNFDIIWAPWRKIYVSSPLQKGCFICKSTLKSKNSLLVFSRTYTKVLLNAFPYNNGHLLVAPKRHVGSLRKLKDEERIELIDTIILCQDLLRKILKPQGFNVGLNIGKVAGAGLRGHIHFHIVPRWNGDTNFMPIVAATKIIPQSLEELRETLRRYYKNYALRKKT